MDISKAWGYGAIVLPKEQQWQGFMILNPDRADLAEGVKRALETAKIALDRVPRISPRGRTAIEGFLCSAATELLIRGNQSGLAIFSSALSRHTGKRFWVIDATPDGEGTTTRFTPLDVSTPEAARDEINRRVMPLKMAQALKELLKMKAEKP